MEERRKKWMSEEEIAKRKENLSAIEKIKANREDRIKGRTDLLPPVAKRNGSLPTLGTESEQSNIQLVPKIRKSQRLHERMRVEAQKRDNAYN